MDTSSGVTEKLEAESLGRSAESKSDTVILEWKEGGEVTGFVIKGLKGSSSSESPMWVERRKEELGVKECGR
jgi:hypothetical protein